MKRSLYERAKAFFINMGRSSKLLKGPAVIGLAISMLLHLFLIIAGEGPNGSFA